MSNLDSILVNLLLKQEKVDLDHLGITSEMIDVDIRPVYNFVVQHYNRYGKLPAKSEVRRNFKQFRFIKPSEPIEYYSEKIRTNYQAARLRGVLADASAAYNEEDLAKAIEVFRQGADEILKVSGKAKVVDFGEALKRAPEEIETEHVLAADYPFGDPVLDQDLVGMEKGDWALIAGNAAAGKTWWLLKLAYNLWRKHKLKILFVSLELSTKIILRRLYSIAAKVSYSRFRRNCLTAEERARFHRVAKKEMDGVFEIISAADDAVGAGNKFGSLDHIRQKVLKHKPDILCVDGLYLAMDMDKWGETVRFANDFHMLLQEMKTPAITTTQLKNIKDTSNPQLSDLAFTAAFQQATDFVFLLAKDPKMRQEHFSMVTVGKAREAEDCQKYYLQFDPGAKIYLERIDKRVNNPLMEDINDGAQEKSGKSGGKGKGLKKLSRSSGKEDGGAEKISGGQEKRNYLSEEQAAYSNESY